MTLEQAVNIFGILVISASIAGLLWTLLYLTTGVLI